MANTRSTPSATLGGAQVLTARQQEIWNYLVEYVDRHGYPPTVREIGEQVGLASPSTVHAHLANLERAGLLKRDPTKPRALELIGRERTAPQEAEVVEIDGVARLPLLGAIAAGGPLLAEERIEEYVELPERLAKGDFLLRVKGESMIEAGILDGDLVIVQRAQDARNGEIAAGGPLLAEQNVEEYVPMPASTRGDFLLRVKGESMIDAGILDGDLVIVQRAQTARNGEIVVALAGEDESADEATVKTFYREKGRVRLQPENASMEPIYAAHVQVLGRVVGVFREL